MKTMSHLQTDTVGIAVTVLTFSFPVALPPTKIYGLWLVDNMIDILIVPALD